jgi:hypothetical protein
MNGDICIECERENDQLRKEKGWCRSYIPSNINCKKHHKNRIHTSTINYNSQMGFLIPRSYIQPSILDKKIKITQKDIDQLTKDFDKNMYMLLPRN